MIGGTGPNQLIGRAGQVKFKPSKATDLIFAGQPKQRTPGNHPTPPGGTFYVYKKGRLIPVPLSNLYPAHDDGHLQAGRHPSTRRSDGSTSLTAARRPAADEHSCTPPRSAP